ncbi:MAG: glutamine amidotransferase, partial [Cyanobacteria bacterium P01_H01_bin.121]
GPMSANDEHLDFIRAELDWLPAVLDTNTPFLGICLGAQILARVLGAQVAKHPQQQAEIGYFPITGHANLRSLSHVFQWHFEGFDLPSGMESLASTTMFPNQAFRATESVYGLQFHPEITASLIIEWTTRGAAALTTPGAQSRMTQLQQHQQHGAQVQQWLASFLQDWLATPRLANCA